MIRRVEGVELDLGDLQLLPGMINAHDHLEFALFPRLGNGPYPNAGEWARDIYHPDQSPIREHLSVPKRLRLLWGGLRNLLSGVTTVAHHNPYDELFDQDFPVRVVKHFGWAHSLDFAPSLMELVNATPPDAPFLIHLGEGTDAASAAELTRLRALGALNRRTVLVHGVGLTAEDWQLVADKGAAMVWCPQSNLFTLGRTLAIESLPKGIAVALGTDSPLTSQGDLLDELRGAAAILGVDTAKLCPMVTHVPREILRLPPRPDWIAAAAFSERPELVVIGERIHLIGRRLAEQLPRTLRDQFNPILLQGRPEVLVRWNIASWIADTARRLDGLPLTLSGREILA
jgi:cytosine/adenosine deaminase-related metal-dependent hydrolase